MIFEGFRCREFPARGSRREPDLRRTALKSRVQCTIFAVLVTIAMADRNVGPVRIHRWRHPKSPSKPSPPSAISRLRNGTPAPIRRPIRTAWKTSTRWLHPAPQAIRARFKTAYNPFVSHAFFAAAEASGSACARTGWGPRHLLARLDGKIAGIVPCYLKSHSQGEYVFDRGWADAYERAGGRYYPKLQASVPFTPATGPRLLIRDDVDRERIGEALAQRADGAVQRHQRLLGPRHLRARGGSEISRRARIPAAQRPAVPLAQ